MAVWPSPSQFAQDVNSLQRAPQRMVRDPHVDLGRFEVRMPKERLNYPDVDALFDEKRRGRVPKPVWG